MHHSLASVLFNDATLLPVKKKKDQCHKSAFFSLSQFLSMQPVLRYRRVMVLGLSFPEGSSEKNFLEAH